MYTEKELYKWFNINREFIEDAYVTSVKELNFNDMEGYSVRVNIKVITKEGYKNKLLGLYLNSSYLDCYEDENGEEINETFESHTETFLECALMD